MERAKVKIHGKERTIKIKANVDNAATPTVARANNSRKTAMMTMMMEGKQSSPAVIYLSDRLHGRSELMKRLNIQLNSRSKYSPTVSVM